jgi:hypothetical protein
VQQVVRELEAQPRRKVLTQPVRGAAVVLTGLLLLGISLYTADIEQVQNEKKSFTFR